MFPSESEMPTPYCPPPSPCLGRVSTLAISFHPHFSGSVVFLGWEFAVVQSVQIAAVVIPLPVQDGEPRVGGCVVLRGRGDIFEFEGGTGVLVGVMVHHNLDLGAGEGSEGEDRSAESQ